MFSHLSGICPHLDFSGIPKLYTAFKEYQALESGGGEELFAKGKEIFAMAGAAAMVVNAAVDQIIDENRIGKEGGDSEQTVNDRIIIIFAKDRRCVGWTQREWGDKLGVSASAIAKTTAWKAILTERERQREALNKGGYSAIR